MRAASDSLAYRRPVDVRAADGYIRQMFPDATTWTSKPGSYDPLHFLEPIEDSEATLGFPVVRASPVESWPETLIAFHLRKSASPGDGLHFFTDDYRFERVWNNPGRYVEQLKRSPVVLSPDFSVYADMPIAMQIWQVYRQRWTCKMLQSAGVKCIPVVSWGDIRSYGFAFLGVERGSTIAVTSVGRADNHEAWDAGMRHGLRFVEPAATVVVGPPVKWLAEECKVIQFDSGVLGMLRQRRPVDKQMLLMEV